MQRELTITNGYIIQERQKTVPLYEAYKILSTKARRRYANAVRNGDSATLYSHIFRCPHCGQATPAYDYALFHDRKPPTLDKATLSEWAQLQTILFDTTPAFLPIQNPSQSDGQVLCPHCQTLAHASTVSYTVTVETTAYGVALERSIAKTNPQSDEFPFIFRERLVLDLAHNDVYMELYDQNGGYSRTGSLLTTPALPNAFLADLIDDNIVVKRNIRRALAPFWPNGFPFTVSEMSFARCILLTMFVNFPRSFYDELPLNLETERIDPSVVKPDMFHDPDSARAQFDRSPLSKYKSLRRAVFNRPSLLFYTEELEWLFALLGDINRFHTVLEYRHLPWLLFFLHTYSGSRVFLEDYSRINGHQVLCRILSELSGIRSEWYFKACEYAALSPFARERQQQAWADSYDSPTISTPLDIPKYLRDDTFNGFSFRCLKNTCECHQVGVKMNNCLVDWTSSTPVIAVYRKTRVVAAMEVRDRHIVQAYKPHNISIEPHTSLHNAITAWCEKHHIRWYNDEDLPY